MAVTLSADAASRIKEILSERDLPETAGLRIGIKGGGCSGFEYELTFDDQHKDTDHVLEFEGLEVFVDGMSFIYLQDVTIDYLDSLQGAGFKIDNPKATGTCGCGHSFSM